MSKKKPPYIVPVVKPAAEPVVKGDCFRTFLAEAQSIGNEVAARRAFDADVSEYMAERELTSDFEAWRAKRVKP